MNIRWLWSWMLPHRPPEDYPEDRARSGMVSRPIVIKAQETASEAAKQAFYRLDAILRHLEQHATVPMARLQEFRAEAYTRAAYLLQAKVVTQEEHDELLRPIVNLIGILS